MSEAERARDPPARRVIIRRPALEKKLGVCRSTIYNYMNPAMPVYDPTFPKPIQLGTSHSVGWVEAEVDAWLELAVGRRDRKRPAVAGT